MRTLSLPTQARRKRDAAKENDGGDRGRRGSWNGKPLSGVCPGSVSFGSDQAPEEDASRVAARDCVSEKGGEPICASRATHTANDSGRQEASERHECARRIPAVGRQARRKELTKMQDVIFVVCSVGFFAIAIAYVWACDRLK
jgi:hypothetical protein